MNNPKNDAYYIQKILTDLFFIRKHMEGVSLAALEQNEILLDSMLFRLIQVQENAKKLTEVVAATPLERILLETDAPYLAPEPFRGKINHSAYIEYIAEAIAAIKGVSASAVLNQTAQNAKNLFNI